LVRRSFRRGIDSLAYRQATCDFYAPARYLQHSLD